MVGPSFPRPPVFAAYFAAYFAESYEGQEGYESEEGFDRPAGPTQWLFRGHPQKVNS